MESSPQLWHCPDRGDVCGCVDAQSKDSSAEQLWQTVSGDLFLAQAGVVYFGFLSGGDIFTGV